MTGTPRFPWPQRTTAWASGLLLVTSVLLLLVAARVELPVTTTFIVPLDGPAVAMAAGAARAAAFIILATGVAGELGVTARSLVGRTALILWGTRDLVLLLLQLIPFTIGSASGGGYVALQLLFAVAALAAAIQVVRARVLSGPARWAILPIAVVDCFFAVVSDPPPSATDLALRIMLALSAWPTEFIHPVLTLLAAVAFLLWGRTEALKHRAQVIHDAW